MSVALVAGSWGLAGLPGTAALEQLSKHSERVCGGCGLNAESRLGRDDLHSSRWLDQGPFSEFETESSLFVGRLDLANQVHLLRSHEHDRRE